MTTKIQLRQSQWFYDTAGYYSYILLNGSEDQFNDIQKILKESGLRVLLAGKSYRPASNGIQYQWYIRVSDESGKHPTQERVRDIFVPYVLTEAPVPELEKIRNRIAEQEEEIEKLKATLKEKERLYQTVVRQLEFASKHNQELQVIYEKTQPELQEYRQMVYSLELRLRQIQETSLKPEDVDQLLQDYEKTIQWFKQELERKESEFNSWISDFELEIQKRERKIVDLENKLAIVEEEKKQIIDQLQESLKNKESDLQKGNSGKLFREMLGVLLPNIEFLSGSFDTLWNEMPDYVIIIALRDLVGLSDPKLKAKRVQSTKEWMERHIEDAWRLYYRKCEESRYQVLISHKNTQKIDIERLKHQ